MRSSPGRRHRWQAVTEFVVDLPRWLLLAALVFAPWAYGGTTARSAVLIEATFGGVVALWIISALVAQKRILLPLGLVIASAMLLAQGWLAVWNFRSLHDPDYQIFAAVRGWIHALPASIDGGMSLQWMLRVTVLTGVLLFATDLARRPTWVLRIWIAIAVAGGSIAALGLLQKASAAELPFWQPAPQYSSPYFFASYYYHANAGAFLNLTLPLTAGLAIRAAQRPGAVYQRAAWFTATLLILIGCAVNTSRMAQLLAICTVISVVAWPARRYLMRVTRGNFATTIGAVILIFAVIVAIAQVSHVDKPFTRWMQQTHEIPSDARWVAQRLAFAAVCDAGWFGSGPGTFAAVFPQYEVQAGMKPEGEWQHLHEDYLQTLLEWGWIGGACLAVIFFGGISSGLVALHQSRGLFPTPRIARLLPFLLIALGATAIHALVDFPLQVCSLQIYVAVYLGICWGAWSLNVRDRNNP